MNPLDMLLPAASSKADTVTLRVGTVAAGGVLLAGDTDPVPVALTIGSPGLGDRVLVAQQGRRVYVIAHPDTSTPWTTFTAQIRQQMTGTPATITSTLIYGRYRWVGPNTVHAKASATITGNSTNGAGLQLPFTAAVREYGIAATITGTSAPTAQVAGAMSADKAHVVVVSSTFAFCDMATGNRISYDITYEVA